MITQFAKDPNATLDYVIDWATYLAGDTVVAASFTVTAGLNVVSFSNTSTTSTVWLSGGTIDTVYTVTGQITTAAGRIDERSFTVIIQQQ